MRNLDKIISVLTGPALILSIPIFILTSCSKDTSVKLFNGTDLSNWEMVSFDSLVPPENIFSVEGGVIRDKGEPRGYIITRESYSDYKLHVEWRWAEEPTNSGVLLHVQELNSKEYPLCIEAQLQNGKAGDFVLIGQGSGMTVHDTAFVNHPDSSRFMLLPKFEESSENPAGEWNTYDITCSGSEIELLVNGVLQHKAVNALLNSGRIALQSEGSAIEFRNVYLVPIEE